MAANEFGYMLRTYGAFVCKRMAHVDKSVARSVQIPNSPKLIHVDKSVARSVQFPNSPKLIYAHVTRNS
jgi:hypothetical protein